MVSTSRQRRRLLILGDEPGMRRELEKIFSDLEVTASEISDQVPVLVRRVEPDVVLFDFGTARVPAGATQSLELLRQIVKLSPDTRIIAMTEYNARELAVAAVGLGAADFYHKPLDAGVLSIVVRRAFRIRELEEENWRLREQSGSMALEGIIGVSDALRSLCRAVEKVAPTNATVLLLGESGTGKELLARALHRLSGRARAPFVAINCAAIPETLLESELFGHERGAFTGAVKQTLGKIEMANRGSLFLDEIGDLPLPLQVKLLRFLQDRVIERIGGRQPIPVDVRIVCATNQDLPKLMAEGRFREDLYYRLNEFTIKVPPLRERPNDALLLAHYFLNKFNTSLGRSVRGFSKEAAAAVSAHHWPGNVRELENGIKRAIIMCEGKQIDLRDLELTPVQSEGGGLLTLKQTRERAERAMIQRALVETQSNISLAAKLLGVSRPTLYDLMKEYDLK